MTTPFRFDDASLFSPKQIQLSITNDFLAFTTRYCLNGSSFAFDLDNGTKVDLLDDGVLLFTPATLGASTKHIILSCAVHGNETAPIEICNEYIRKILTQEMQVAHRVMFVFGNIESILAKQRFVEENLNRLFIAGNEVDSLEGRRASKLMRHVDDFFSCTSDLRFHYDLHTAIRPSKNEKFAVYPYLHGKQHNKQQLAFLAMCNVKTILLSQAPSNTFSYFSSLNYGAEAFTVELGKVMPFGQNDMSKFTEVKQVLADLICQTSISIPEYNPENMDVFVVNQVINKTKDDFSLNFSDDIANFTDFAKGDILAQESGASYPALVDGEAIVFPNAGVALGQRALLTVIPYEL